MTILWLGPLSDQTKKRNSTLSPAADNWQRGLIKGLQANGVEVEVFSFQPNPLFPKGQLKFYDNKSEDFVFQVGYFNLPGLREKSLIRRFKKKVKRESEYDAVITYNCLEHHVALGKWFRDQGVPWISIIADDEYKLGADLYVFLSYGYYQQAQVEPKIHLDGGVDELVNSYIKITEKKILHFSGSLTKWTGIDEFARMFTGLNFPDTELHIFGKGEDTYLKKLKENKDNIKLKGFVSKGELDAARKEAYAFVNPRPVDVKGGEFNFPSKLLEYLKYGKPIISTRTPGLAPVYYKLVEFYDPNNLESLKKALQKIISYSEQDHSTIHARISHFAESHSWYHQAHQLIESVKKLHKLENVI